MMRWSSSLFFFYIQSMPTDVNSLLRAYAAQYETASFLPSDPSFFMRQVEGTANQEVTAFIASSLSYGSRKQFMPKIQSLLDMAEGDMYSWVSNRRFLKDIPDDDRKCFYRLYTCHAMCTFLCALRSMLNGYGSIGAFVKANSTDGMSALKAITGFFAACGTEPVIPKNTVSACKRLCMFLRWMVRDGSPVDLGLWTSFIDKRTLVIPMDTHVLQEAHRLGLIECKTASMAAALKLSRRLAETFPDDPLKGDFALFGYGVSR